MYCWSTLFLKVRLILVVLGESFLDCFSMVASEKFLIGETNQKFFSVDILCALQVCMQPDIHVY